MLLTLSLRPQNIHFRNIVGGLHNFKEVWPDEGDVNMFTLAQTLHSVGYEYMCACPCWSGLCTDLTPDFVLGRLMPDHAPSHPDEPNGHEGGAFAFQFGFIIAVIQAVTLATRASATGDDISQTVSCIAASWVAPLRGA